MNQIYDQGAGSYNNYQQYNQPSQQQQSYASYEYGMPPQRPQQPFNDFSQPPIMRPGKKDIKIILICNYDLNV